MLLNDTIGHGETKAGSLALLFGGEERFEDPGGNIFIHPDAVVHNADTNAFAIVFLDQVCGGDLDDPTGAFCHGVTGIDTKIEDHLFEMIVIQLGLPKILREFQLDLNFFIE